MAQILILDNLAASRELERYMLESLGYQVVEASSGSEAVSAALRTPPDLVLLDLHMPLLGVFAILAEFRNNPRLAHVPIVALTASDTQGNEVRALQPGFSGYITKSLSRGDFGMRIRTFLARNGIHPQPGVQFQPQPQAAAD